MGIRIDVKERRRIGKTDIYVSPFGFGCSGLGNVFGEIDEQDGINSVFEAVKRGINVFDTSPFYGLTKSETVLGKALRQLPRDEYVLCSKVGRYGISEFDFSAARITKSIDESMQRLGVDYIDIIQCHDIEFGDLDQIVTETLPTLQKLKEDGKIGAVGITGYPLEIYPYVLSCCPDLVDVVLSYCHYNLQNDRLQHLLPAFKNEFGVGVFNASALAMGLLTPHDPPEWHPADAQMKELCKKANVFCEEQGQSLPDIALKYAFQADVASTFVGINSTGTLESNLSALESGLESPLIEKVQEILKPVHNRRWDSGWILAPTPAP